MKKFKVISSLLALVMVLSVITVMPASAATAEEGFFCDFENTSAATGTSDYTAIKNAFGVYTRNLDGTSSGGIAKVIEADGNRGIGVDGQGYLYVPAASQATTGKACIGFSVNGSSFGFVKAAFGGSISSSNKGQYMANIEDSVAPAVSASSTLVNPVAREDGWNDILIVVDIDNSTWTVYMNGSKIGDTYSFLDKYNITKSELGAFYGIGFYEGEKSGDGMIDNISIVCSDDVAASTSVDNKVISAVLPQQIAVEASDINVTKCGSDETVDVASVAYEPNKINITLADELDNGCEYIVTFGDYEGIEVYAYAESNGDDKIGYIKEDFEEDDNRTFTRETCDTKTNVVTDESIQNILTSETKYAGKGAIRVNDLTSDDGKTGADNANGRPVSGKVLVSYDTGNFLFFEPIATDIGVETYEFDCKLYWSSTGDAAGRTFMTGSDTVNGVTGTRVMQIPKDNKWYHVKIEYDTVNDTLSTWVNFGTPTVFENVPTFNSRLRFGGIGTANPGFQMDNYEQYVTVTPLNVEKVRYTDNDGNVTGANLISPATNEIDITFSEEVDRAVANEITLTANGTPVQGFTATPNGKVVTLTNVSLPGNANVVLTIPAANREYNVTTSKVDVTIGSLGLTGADATGSMNENEEITVTASEITATGSANITLIYAFYSDNELVAVDSATKAITGSTVSHTFTINKAFSYDEVKAFVWDGLTTRVPLITSYTVTAQ